MKKLFSIILSTLMLFSVLLTGCTTVTPSTGDETEDGVTYNVIFALATIPPVLGALDSIANENPTYAIIERGKTYSGIEQVENFYNAGFDVSSNKSTGFTNQEFNDMVEKVKELKSGKKDAFFNFYVQDGTALKGAAVASNAGLTKEQFHIYMCEDGTGAYTELANKYIKGKTVTAEKDGVYENYASAVENAKVEFETVMEKTDNANGDSVLGYNIAKAYALASLENFTYYIQDEATVVGILESAGPERTKLLSSFGVDGYEEEVEYKLNLKYQKISEGVANLTEEQRASYLTLMYGDYYQDTYTTLTRKQRAGEVAPSKKLIYIGTRHNGYPKLASNAENGIGGLSDSDSVPTSYAELDGKYKTKLLFACEQDYNVFLSVINGEDSYLEEIDDEAKRKAQVACFNVYIDYIYNLKMTYALYGEEYDLIMKGHPREPIGDWSQWGNRYKVTYGEDKTYVYDKLMDLALQSFHDNDTIGRFIGKVPYGTAAENLAYLGANISICGLPSSTYNGYDTDVDVLFILALTNEDIIGTGKETATSQVKERYEAGNLTFTNSNGEEKTTVFYNTGNIFKALASIAQTNGDVDGYEYFTQKFEKWLTSVYGNTVTDIDEQGFAF